MSDYDYVAALDELLIERPGWTGSFTSATAPGALKAGTRIVKADRDKGGPDDLTPIGTLGTVLGSLYDPALGIAYFIEWDDKPKVAVLAVAWKVGAVQ